MVGKVILKPMVYTPTRQINILGMGEIGGFKWAIVSYGTHPCAYIGLPDQHPLSRASTFDLDDDMVDLDVHWGVTYSDSHLFGDASCWWIGWDYHHIDDYSGYCLLEGERKFSCGRTHKWTSEEIYLEVQAAIKQLKEIAELGCVDLANIKMKGAAQQMAELLQNVLNDYDDVIADSFEVRITHALRRWQETKDGGAN